MAVNSEKRFDAGDTGKSSSFFILCLCSNLFYLCPYGCTGLYDPKNIGQFYTTNMDISGTACLVKSFDRVARDALKADMEHLSAEYSSQQEYLDSIDYKLSQCAEHGDAVGREKELRMLKGFFIEERQDIFCIGRPICWEIKANKAGNQRRYCSRKSYQSESDPVRRPRRRISARCSGKKGWKREKDLKCFFFHRS